MVKQAESFSSLFIRGSSSIIRCCSYLSLGRPGKDGKKGHQILRGFLLAVLVAMSTAALRAQEYSGFLSVGSTSLFNKYSFVEYNNAYHSSYSLGPEVTIGGEGRLTSLLGIELSAELGRNTLKVTNSNTATRSSYGINKERVSGDLVLHVPGTFLHGKPYLVLGPEFNRLAPYGPAASATSGTGFLNDPYVYLHASTRLGFNFGAGLERKLHSNWSLRLDLRDHLFSAPRYGLPSYAVTGAYFPVQGSVNNVEVSVGLVYHFAL